MFSLWIPFGEDRDDLLVDLWEAGTTGITDEEDGVRAFFEDGADVSTLRHYRAIRHEDDGQDWVTAVQEQWQSFAVGERWWLAPEWDKAPVPTGRTLLRIYPGLACGTGWHAATQLCLAAMEAHVGPGSRVLDVGTGSGILAHAAAGLGAVTVFGCDIEHDSTMVAKGNSDASVMLFTGSLRSVKRACIDVIVANLNAATLTSLASDVKRVLRVGGTAILSGFEEDEVTDLVAVFGLAPAATLEQDGWACLVFRYSEGA